MRWISWIKLWRCPKEPTVRVFEIDTNPMKSSILLDILIKVFKTEEHLLVATHLNNMAILLSDSGENEKALDLNKKVYGLSFLKISNWFI